MKGFKVNSVEIYLVRGLIVSIMSIVADTCLARLGYKTIIWPRCMWMWTRHGSYVS